MYTIAIDYGFYSASHFTTSFKIYGITPTEYIHENKE